MSEPQGTAAEALTLQLAVNDILYYEKGKDARFLRLGELDPFHAVSSYITPTVAGTPTNLFNIKVPTNQCLVLTYINAYVTRAFSSTPTDSDLVLFNQAIFSDIAALGTRVNSVSKLLTLEASLNMYVNM
jgi:hypothetical protein